MKKNEKLAQVEPVKIKPLLGMKPGLWLFICYMICFVAILFAVGILPGIIHGYERVTFKNTPETTAVYVDDRYVGGTPCSVNISSGRHNIKFKIGDVAVDEFDVNIKHPVFFTWLFPRRKEVTRDAVINEEAYKSLTEIFFNDISAYSAVMNYDSTYKYPPLFMRYAQSIKNVDYSKDIFNYAALFITSDEMLEDAKKAFELLGIDYDWSKIENAVQTQNFRTSSLPIYGSIKGKNDLVCDGFTVSGFCYGENENAYNLAGIPVNETMYAFFVEKNREWAPENKAELIKQGLVDENYLAGITLTTKNPTFKAITNISYHAAKAFCEWLSKETGKNVFLPDEIQWTAAASTADPTFTKTTTALSSKQGPAGMFGGVWEFTSTYYVPNERGVSSDIQNFLDANGIICEPIVKGGSYISNVDSISAYTIGIVSPFLCADTYGFRIAWI